MQAAPVASTKLASWGNSKATRIPKEVLGKANVLDNQQFDIIVDGESIILTPVNSQPKTLSELLANYKDDGVRTGELDWGESQGKEL